jgi:hypothetical protein
MIEKDRFASAALGCEARSEILASWFSKSGRNLKVESLDLALDCGGHRATSGAQNLVRYGRFERGRLGCEPTAHPRVVRKVLKVSRTGLNLSANPLDRGLDSLLAHARIRTECLADQIPLAEDPFGRFGKHSKYADLRFRQLKVRAISFANESLLGVDQQVFGLHDRRRLSRCAP